MLTYATRTRRRMRRSPAGTGGLFCLLALGGLALSGCHTDMWVQPKVKPQAESDIFPDDQSSRPLVPHTVARGFLKTDQEIYGLDRRPSDYRSYHGQSGADGRADCGQDPRGGDEGVQ